MTTGEILAVPVGTDAPKRVSWLLDVDGTINARTPGWDGEIRAGFAESGGRRYLISWAPALVRRILAIAESGMVELIWCTTWCADADQIESLLGLPALARAWSFELTGATATASKLEAAQAIIDSGDALVWTDDGAIPPDGPQRSALTSTGRALLVAPSHSTGLQPEDLDEIESFISAIRAG